MVISLYYIVAWATDFPEPQDREGLRRLRNLIWDIMAMPAAGVLIAANLYGMLEAEHNALPNSFAAVPDFIFSLRVRINNDEKN